MATEGVLILGGCACLLTAGSWGFLLSGPSASPSTIRSGAKWPLLAGAAVFVYLVWERQAVIDKACESLRLAMDFQARGAAEANTLDFDTTVALFSRAPRLREATDICKAASAYD